MKIKCHNIGKISDADIDIQKITLIAGLNSTGKSTIGKSLFCIFNALYKFDEKINRLKKNSIIKKFSRSSKIISAREDSVDENVLECAKALVEGNVQSLNEIQRIVNEKIPLSVLENKSDDIINEIADLLVTPNEEIIEWFLSDLLDNEFNKQIQTLSRVSAPSSITLTIQKQDIRAFIVNNEVDSIQNTEILNTRAIYLDDPFVLDFLDFPFWGVQHQRELIRRLKDQPLSNYDEIAQKFIVNKKINRILEKISSACDGNIVQKGPKFSFQDRTTGKSLNIKNLSTGLKTFVIIKRLLENGSLEQNGTLILDEPEVHLHPEWQKIFAEVIVLIQIEFGMHILINSHSPYFIEAIDIYEQKYGIRDNCNFYLSNSNNGTFDEVSDNLESIYSLLFSPLQNMENERAALIDNNEHVREIDIHG
ncbi:MAG: ATP-binding protein [Fibrobacter sp.]|uniref:AAA family ATPase n=1 Tax=Fibrobacter sp. TaxID=35828 RepID=UPI001B2F4811|nr:AAA family ATPase [Fibrobacter sp.]MBO7061031.1 ATP-binding protein [Fibrobacter sp.]